MSISFRRNDLPRDGNMMVLYRFDQPHSRFAVQAFAGRLLFGLRPQPDLRGPGLFGVHQPGPRPDPGNDPGTDRQGRLARLAGSRQ